ncbi:MAG: hypothetical protein LBQ77_02950 [Treponema sp.]|nr:hypothetical protein [Treponema sp.]
MDRPSTLLLKGSYSYGDRPLNVRGRPSTFLKGTYSRLRTKRAVWGQTSLTLGTDPQHYLKGSYLYLRTKRAIWR